MAKHPRTSKPGRVARLIAHGAALAALLVNPWGCSAPEVEEDAGAAQPPSWVLELQAEVDAGEEETVCRYFVVPEGGLKVQRFEHQLSDRSHHILLFPTSLKPADVPTMDLIRDCDEGSPDKLVSRGILYGGQPGGASVGFPEDSGLELPGGAVVLLEQHIVNTGADVVHARGVLRMYAAPPAAPRAAGMLHFYNWSIFVPALKTGRAEMKCEVPEDIQLSFGHGHMHQRGTRFHAWLVLPDGSQRDMIDTGDWDAETKAFGEDWHIPKGSSVRFACDYANSDERPYYQGLSAIDNEMCSLTAGYVSATGERLPPAYEWCASPGSSVVGSGALGCAALDQCVASAWQRGPLEFADEFQACWSMSCEATALRELALCRAVACAEACLVVPNSGGVVALATTSAECAECVDAACSQESASCAAEVDCN